MKQPEKWKETVDPFSIKFNQFKLIEVLGYPHARNDVFYCNGEVQGENMFCFIKYASKPDSNIKHEVEVIKNLDFDFLPEIIDFDTEDKFCVTKEMEGERLSNILKNNQGSSLDYMFEYGQTLAKIHSVKKTFSPVKHRKFFDIPSIEYLTEHQIEFIYNYLIQNKPKTENKCFCHGDFHYANILWKNKHISAVLDWELSGIGNKEFDIAWAIINRPSQQFLKTQEEKKLFLKGYQSIGQCDKDLVEYYMILIYTHFISIDKNNNEYKEFVKGYLEEAKDKK